MVTLMVLDGTDCGLSIRTFRIHLQKRVLKVSRCSSLSSFCGSVQWGCIHLNRPQVTSSALLVALKVVCMTAWLRQVLNMSCSDKENSVPKVE